MATIARWVVAAIVTVHGLIHLLGVVKGLGWAQIPQLTEPISPTMARAWLLATVAVVAAGVMLAAGIRWWWPVMGAAAVVSQAVILTSWNDAKAGTAANLVMLLAAGFGFAAAGPRSFAAEYVHRADAAVAAVSPTGARAGQTVSEDDLAALPRPVAEYLRRSGAVGQPRVSAFRARIHGRIRSAADQPWMDFTGEQTNTCGPTPQRLFHITATKAGVPVDVLHVYTHGTATMRGRAAYLIPFLHAAGPEMDRSETVTVFNDLCILAPAALLDAPVTWQTLDAHRVRGEFTLAGTTVTAVLAFDDDHDLVDFISDDRARASADASSFTPLRWSTPIGTYRWFGPRRSATTGEAHWHAPGPEGEFAYLEFRLDHISYDIAAPHHPTQAAEAPAAEAPRRS